MACTISYHAPGCDCLGKAPLKRDWTPTDVRTVLNSALDGFAEEFFGVTYKSLLRKDKLKIMRAVKADVATRFAYEWMMRTV